MKEPINRFRYLAGRRSFERELDAEVQFHIETRAEELAQGGMTLRAALAQARREFGSGASMREETRSAWQLQWLEDLASDLRYAALAFRRNPVFAVTAIACLALGIGANTAMFSIVNEALLSTPSCRDPRSLVHVMIGGNTTRRCANAVSFATLESSPGSAARTKTMKRIGATAAARTGST